MTFHPYDVVVVPFPFIDRLSEKRRPALVVSSLDLSENLGRAWLSMITSAPTQMLGDVQIADLETAGLPVASTIRTSKITTLDHTRILRRIGKLSGRDLEAAQNALRLCAAF